MKTATVMFRCAIGGFLGGLPGILIIAVGHNKLYGFGFAMIGAATGLALFASSIFYKTSVLATLMRGSSLFLQAMVARAIPGGDLLVPFEVEPVSPRSQPGYVDAAKADQRLGVGMIIGAVVSVILGILLATFIVKIANREEPRPLFVQLIVGIIILLPTVMAGGGVGAAIGAFTVPGIHRRNILLGTALGTLLGAGLATVIYSVARDPSWIAYAAFCPAFGIFGMLFGLCSGDNFDIGPQESVEFRDAVDDPNVVD